nr:MAG TPA: hypothetical protein [Caudoviricetes sp.]
MNRNSRHCLSGVCLHCLRCYNQIFFKSIDDSKKDLKNLMRKSK